MGRAYVVQDDQLIGPSTLMGTDGVEDTVVVNLRDELLSKEQQEHARDQGQVEVMDLEWAVQLERWAVAHKLASSEDNSVVCNQHNRSGLQGRHWSGAWLELEVLWVVAHNGREGLVKDRP